MGWLTSTVTGDIECWTSWLTTWVKFATTTLAGYWVYLEGRQALNPVFICGLHTVATVHIVATNFWCKLIHTTMLAFQALKLGISECFLSKLSCQRFSTVSWGFVMFIVSIHLNKSQKFLLDFEGPKITWAVTFNRFVYVPINIFLLTIIIPLFVTGFWKTDRIVTLGLFHFIGPANGHSHTLHIHSAITRHGGLVCFSRASFADPVNSWLRQWDPWGAIHERHWSEIHPSDGETSLTPFKHV